MKKKKIKINVLGAGQEVGKNCFIVKYPTGEEILLDCGLKAENDCAQEERYPLDIKKLRKIDLTFMSHPHLDHLGALPRACKHGLGSPIIIANEIARDVAEAILLDSLKLEKQFYGEADYNVGWVNYVLNQMTVQKSGKCGNVSWSLVELSHIPGSVSILLEHPETRSILYPGDVRMSATRLMKERDFLPHADIMFIDSTYGDSIHPNRQETEVEFERIITETIKKDGRVVVPCFSVARSQEILILLDKISQRLKVPVYLDGMGRGITNTYLKYAEAMDNEDLLQAVEGIKFIKTKEDRFKALSGPAIIVPSGGMVSSPLVHFYLKSIAEDKNSAIILTGFQAKGTGGYELTTKGTIVIDNETIKPICSISHLSFSSHADSVETESLIKTVSPEIVIAIHGEKPGINGVKKIAKKLKIKAIAPKTGEKIQV